jgi:dihydroxy-acid dehydratase
LVANGGYDIPASQTPWQELFREKVGRLDQGMTLDGADKYQDIARRCMPRDNH